MWGRNCKSVYCFIRNQIVSVHLKDVRLTEPALSTQIIEVVPGEGIAPLLPLLEGVAALPQTIPLMLEHLGGRGGVCARAPISKTVGRESWDSLLSGKEVRKMKYLKAGVVGMGFMGYAHVEALRRLGNVEVAAITSGSGAQQRAEALGIEQYYTDYRDMVLSSGIDAIHICTPNGTHYDIARFALEHGVHVLCEKPFTVTIEEAKDLCALAKETGLRNAVNFHNRFYPMANTIRRMS